jgi:hypothetical protein
MLYRFGMCTRQKTRFAVLVALTAAALGMPLSAGAQIPAGKKVVGYFPEYRLSALPLVNFDNLTHVIFWGLDADAAGNLVVGGSAAAGLPQVESVVHAHGKKISVCVGGWLSDAYFSPLANSSAARANFIAALVGFCQSHRLDGVDLDWEPVDDADVPAYSTLLRELGTALHAQGMLLSVAVAATHYDVQPTVAPYVDWIAVMAYDMNWAHADHSTYADSVNAMNFWAQSGIDRAKLMMGVPFFGLNEGWANALSYAEIVDLYHPAPDVNDAGGYGFNGPDLIKDKTTFALGQGFGGMMIWELGQDTFDSCSLLTAMVSAMSGNQPVPPPIPAPWQSADIGSPGVAGSSVNDNGAFTVTGAGVLGTGRADSFRFVYQPMNADGEIRARIPALTASASSAVAGVMIRESLSANARCAMLGLTSGRTLVYLARSSTGGKMASMQSGAAPPAPGDWVRLVRAGKVITAYKSADGVSWTKVSSTSISMASTVNVGLIVASQSKTVSCRATFDNLAVTP